MKKSIVILFSLLLCFMTSCPKNSNQYTVELLEKDNYIIESFAFNREDYEIRDAASDTYEFLEIDNFYQNSLNFRVVKDYGDFFYRTKAIYRYDLNTNSVQEIVKDLDTEKSITEFTYLNEFEYLYCMADWSKSENDFPYEIIYEKDGQQQVLYSSNSTGFTPLANFVSEENKIYMVCNYPDAKNGQLFEFQDEKLTSLMEIDKIIDGVVKASNQRISLMSQTNDKVNLSYYENGQAYSIEFGNSVKTLPLLFDNILLCMEPIYSDQGALKSVNTFLIDKKTQQKQSLESLDFLYQKAILLSGNSAFIYRDKQGYYLKVDDEKKKIKIVEMVFDEAIDEAFKVDEHCILTVGQGSINKITMNE